MRLIDRKGQSTLEYAILIVVIIAALISLQTYIKRGLQGRLKSSADDIGDGFSTAKAANYYKTIVSISNTTETFQNGASQTRIQAGGEMTTKTYANILMNTEGEYWANGGTGN